MIDFDTLFRFFTIAVCVLVGVFIVVALIGVLRYDDKPTRGRAWVIRERDFWDD